MSHEEELADTKENLIEGVRKYLEVRGYASEDLYPSDVLIVTRLSSPSDDGENYRACQVQGTWATMVGMGKYAEGFALQQLLG